MTKKEFLGYFSKQLNEVSGSGVKLFYGITDVANHRLLEITEDGLDMLYMKLVDEGYSLAYPAGTDFRLPWFELKE
jgi:hypothetical protein